MLCGDQRHTGLCLGDPVWTVRECRDAAPSNSPKIHNKSIVGYITVALWDLCDRSIVVFTIHKPNPRNVDILVILFLPIRGQAYSNLARSEVHVGNVYNLTKLPLRYSKLQLNHGYVQRISLRNLVPFLVINPQSRTVTAFGYVCIVSATTSCIYSHKTCYNGKRFELTLVAFFKLGKIWKNVFVYESLWRFWKRGKYLVGESSLTNHRYTLLWHIFHL